MNEIRIRFVRGEEVKYISHLDLMRVFERALRRAHIPIAYSQGFNPHPQMVFGLPLSVGVTSEAEYGDFELSADMDPGEFSGRLNQQLPKGLKIIGAKRKCTKSNIMASIFRASYVLYVFSGQNLGINDMQKKIEDFMQRPELIVKKEGKKGSRDIDIRPMIHEFHVETDARPSNENGFFEDGLCFSVLLSAGSMANLKPELLVSAFNEVEDAGIGQAKIHRTGLFVEWEGRLLEPLNDVVLTGS